MRDKILYFAIKYEGNYDKITTALRYGYRHEIIEYKGLYITIVDSEYPDALRTLVKPPYILFYKGDLSLLDCRAISIVGSRNHKSYGSLMTRKLVNNLSNEYVVVSGMAKGIDSVAHISCINSKGKTIAVLGSGIDYIYPKENTKLYHRLAKGHLILSEYPSTTVPKPYYFPFRNRIIAALGEELYVMQAGLRSGTMLSVNEALELNKEIIVLPYRIDDEHGEGCNYLIEQGASILTLSKLK